VEFLEPVRCRNHHLAGAGVSSTGARPPRGAGSYASGRLTLAGLLGLAAIFAALVGQQNLR
jgi:hypothetical protein